MRTAMADLKLDRLFVVYPGGQALTLAERVELLPPRSWPQRVHLVGSERPNSVCPPSPRSSAASCSVNSGLWAHARSTVFHRILARRGVGFYRPSLIGT